MTSPNAPLTAERIEEIRADSANPEWNALCDAALRGIEAQFLDAKEKEIVCAALTDRAVKNAAAGLNAASAACLNLREKLITPPSSERKEQERLRCIDELARQAGVDQHGNVHDKSCGLFEGERCTCPPSDTAKQQHGDDRPSEVIVREMRAPPSEAAPMGEIHPTSGAGLLLEGIKDPLGTLVSGFAAALLRKLRDSEEKYGWNSGWLKNDWADDLRRDIRRHVEKGDPRDVAAYCAFAWHHNWSLANPSPQADAGEIEKLTKDFAICAGFNNFPIQMSERVLKAFALIERQAARCEAYKGQVECGAREIERQAAELREKDAINLAQSKQIAEKLDEFQEAQSRIASLMEECERLKEALEDKETDEQPEENCSYCGGRGKIGNGRNRKECPACHGYGSKKAEDDFSALRSGE